MPTTKKTVVSSRTEPDTGATAESAREFLRQSSELGNWSTAYAQKILGLDRAGVRDALAALEMSGYVERSRKDEWRNTKTGDAAVRASAAKPIHRDTAEKKLQELRERAEAVNADPQYAFFANRLLVYGPYLTRAAQIRDVDVAVELAPRHSDRSRQNRAMEQRAEAAAKTGKRFKSHQARENYARTEILDFLKGRTRSISIGEAEDWITRQPHHTIFERSESTGARKRGARES